ncbi:MAG: hypothetical protein KAV87_05860 [Desulfobacteraceae bacterium]|nr:hypothetical protein [Desulfobacteraceae bacterium]
MNLTEFKSLGKFGKSLDKNSLVKCPECKGWYGVMKWVRRATVVGARCPGCETLFGRKQIFAVKPAVKLPEPEQQPEEETKPENAVIINPDGTKTYQELGLEVKVNARSKQNRS